MKFVSEIFKLAWNRACPRSRL